MTRKPLVLCELPFLDQGSDDWTEVEHFLVSKEAVFYDVAGSAGEDDVLKRVADSAVFAVPSWWIGFAERSAAVGAVGAGVHDGLHLLKSELVPTAFLLVGAVVFNFAAGFAEITLPAGMTLLRTERLKRLDFLAEITSPHVLLREIHLRQESYSH